MLNRLISNSCLTPELTIPVTNLGRRIRPATAARSSQLPGPERWTVPAVGRKADREAFVVFSNDRFGFLDALSLSTRDSQRTCPLSAGVSQRALGPLWGYTALASSETVSLGWGADTLTYMKIEDYCHGSGQQYAGHGSGRSYARTLLLPMYRPCYFP